MHLKIRLLTLVVKPIDTVDGCALMISAQQEKVFWIFDFVRLYDWLIGDAMKNEIILTLEVCCSKIYV